MITDEWGERRMSRCPVEYAIRKKWEEDMKEMEKNEHN